MLKYRRNHFIQLLTLHYTDYILLVLTDWEVSILLYCVIALIVIMVIMASIKAHSKKKSLKEDIAYERKRLKRKGYVISAQLKYNNQWDDIHYYIAADDVHKKLFIFDLSKSDLVKIVIGFDEITGFDTQIRTRKGGSVSRAVVGGIIAGEAGAVVGGLTA